MSLIDYGQNYEKQDHITLNPNLPIKAGQKKFNFIINGDDYMLNDWYHSYFYFIIHVNKERRMWRMISLP